MVAFFIPGAPKGKGRPRFNKAGQVFTPKATVNYESLIALAAREAMGETAILDSALAMHMRVTLLPPSGASKANRFAMLFHERKPTVKPDLDNVIKAVLDGCAKVVFLDDKQVCHIAAVKNYGETEGVEVHFTEIMSGEIMGAYPWR